MDRTVVLALISMLVTGVIRALSADVPNFRFLTKTLRAILASALGIVAGVVDAMTSGAEFSQAAMAALTTMGPSLIMLLIEALGAANTTPGAGAVPMTKDDVKAASRRPGPMFPLVGLALIALAGCGAAKIVCPVIDLASQACPFVMVKYTDDVGAAQVEPVPKANIELQAKMAAVARLAASYDAGADH